MDNLLELVKEKISSIENLENLESLKAEYLGKSGIITSEMKKLGSMTDEERKSHGKLINDLRDQITQLFLSKRDALSAAAINLKLSSEWVDVSLPSRTYPTGTIHPISKATMELTEIFAAFGFEVEEGPSIEEDWYNFTALNIDENHPARQMHDTFYLNGGKLLRTHTSPTQIRTMKSGKPPFKFIAPGRTYRCDSDMTHTPMFHQMELLMVDQEVNLTNLKFIATEFMKQFFEESKLEFRFRPSFFPFTEPSFEVDIKMPNKDKWLEVFGCGMIHPNVLKNVDIDISIYRGFAMGMGIERLAMLKYGVKDLRQFFEGDANWTSHYNFSAFDIPSRLGGLTL
ncbi:MAG: hypothetical protein RLZZ59_526 [Pseudomonadota bacterium]|jgi:phenylalanyl-tRNA synthetase alpha chain